MESSANDMHASVLDYLKRNGFYKTASTFTEEIDNKACNQGFTDDYEIPLKEAIDVNTHLVSFNPCENDPYGATSMPIYQTATFRQLGATEFGDYDYTRSGNPTRTALETLVVCVNSCAYFKGLNFILVIGKSRRTKQCQSICVYNWYGSAKRCHQTCTVW